MYLNLTWGEGVKLVHRPVSSGTLTKVSEAFNLCTLGIFVDLFVLKIALLFQMGHYRLRNSQQC